MMSSSSMPKLFTEMVSFPSNGRSTPGYLARPDDDGTHPGIVVIQEWWGLNPHIKDVAERFAGVGYVALAPDLYHGEIAEEPDEALKLAMALDRDRAVAEILAAAGFLQAHDQVSPKHLGVIGWCMGGGLSLSAAAGSSGEFGAAIAFYGRPLDAEDTKHLKVPVLGLFAELDQQVPVSAVHSFEQELQANDIPHEIHVYPGAQHAFFNDTRPHIYHAEAATDAWQRSLNWFSRYLK
jgi:carboxymethylenebutenolidase